MLPVPEQEGGDAEETLLQRLLRESRTTWEALDLWQFMENGHNRRSGHFDKEPDAT
jgi:hypothetical protein